CPLHRTYPCPRNGDHPMSFPFNPQQGLVIVSAELEGPLGKVLLSLALDTGSTVTTAGVQFLQRAGYDPALATKHIQVATGSGTETVPELPVTKLSALGKDRTAFPSSPSRSRLVCRSMASSVWTSFVAGF